MLKIRVSTSLGALAIACLPAIARADDKPPATGAPDIVVTASPFGHGQDDTPAISAHINTDAILARGGASLGDALSQVPGIAASGFATGASRPIIRGMDANRVRLLEDGTSSSDVSDIGPDHGVPIDPLAARSIEVIRGAASLRYGSQAIGGVVNAINDRVPLHLPDRAVSGEVTGSYGSSGNTWQGSGLVDARVGDVALHADAFGRDAGDYGTPLGVQANSFFKGHGESAGASLFPGGGDSRIGLAVTRYDAKYGIPSDVTFIDMHQTKVLARGLLDLGNGFAKSLKFDGSYGDYRHDEINPDGTIAATFTNREWDGRGELLLGAIGPVTNAAVGVEYQHRDFAGLGDAQSYLLPATSGNVAGYLFLDSKVAPTLHLEASGRVEHVRETGTPAGGAATARGFDLPSAAVGLLWQPADPVKLGLTASTTVRAPALTELFARGPHDGPGTFETGNPGLVPERARGLELSLRVRNGRLHFDGSAYSNWFSHYVYGNLTGRTCDETSDCNAGGSYRELVYAQQDAHFRGLEGEAGFDVVSHDKAKLTLNLLGDMTRATFADGTNVPRIPAWRIGGGLRWESDPLDAGFNVTRVGRQAWFGAFDTATPGYVTLDAQLAWRPFAAHRGFELVLAGQNLTHAVERNAAALNKDLVVAPGRSVRVVVKLAG
jgi:iron complex outermembrane receptor protein